MHLQNEFRVSFIFLGIIAQPLKLNSFCLGKCVNNVAVTLNRINLFSTNIRSIALSKNSKAYNMEPVRIKQTVPRARSFREEGYNNRRVFLRSYPLHWGGEDSKSRELEKTAPKGTNDAKEPLKKIITSIFNWGEERVFIFRRYKNKIIVYVISCLPAGFKPPAMISAR